MTIREVLLRVPILGPIVERRWIPNSAERNRHQELVRGRLPGNGASSDPTANSIETPELPAG